MSFLPRCQHRLLCHCAKRCSPMPRRSLHCIHPLFLPMCAGKLCVIPGGDCAGSRKLPRRRSNTARAGSRLKTCYTCHRTDSGHVCARSLHGPLSLERGDQTVARGPFEHAHPVPMHGNGEARCQTPCLVLVKGAPSGGADHAGGCGSRVGSAAHRPGHRPPTGHQGACQVSSVLFLPCCPVLILHTTILHDITAFLPT